MKFAMTLNALALIAGSAAGSVYLAECGGTTDPDVEICYNGVDDDGDLAIDCADSDCLGGEASNIVISEIQFDPAAISDVSGEYVEIHNSGDLCVDVSGWKINEDSGFPATTLPSNALVKPGGAYVIAAEFFPENNCGVVADAEWQYESTLNNDNDKISLADADGNPVVMVEYCNGGEVGGCVGDWPSCSPGVALEYCGDPDAISNNDGTNWSCASIAYGCGDLGTPNGVNSCM